MASRQSSTTNIQDEREYEQVLEKLESRTAPGEFTPRPDGSPAASIIDKIDESQLEKGPVSEQITHRPTGLRVRPF